ncbi:hypothetical protein GCM10025865_30650 [Paraoerskovia sediminicola]|uniref:Uncharacterized protein n=1 Tax=Paraoerskovia sediminicola TaxID=1138587 RepID=A0ABM8G6K4_9CELL|nr:hypothetical protein GCM10025865_30650 [Paraoerskovia sediminicola]
MAAGLPAWAAPELADADPDAALSGVGLPLGFVVGVPEPVLAGWPWPFCLPPRFGLSARWATPLAFAPELPDPALTAELPPWPVAADAPAAVPVTASRAIAPVAMKRVDVRIGISRWKACLTVGLLSVV